MKGKSGMPLRRILCWALLAVGLLTACGPEEDFVLPTAETVVQETLSEDGSYTAKEDVALYLHLYGHLPENYLTKSEARDLGWDSYAGNLWEVAPGMSIGGDRFGNYEGLLPKEEGRTYFECDIGYEGGRRNARRIIFSNDGLIFYTEDHYETFEQLYGEGGRDE